jgi:hypothetical protein
MLPELPPLKVPSAGPDQEAFYTKSIGRGDACITEHPETGDYVDGNVSAPDGPLFKGPQVAPSSELSLK